MSGSAKASVFPVPVCAVATTSRPSRAGGIAPSWTGVGDVKLCLVRLLRSAEHRFNSVKLFIPYCRKAIRSKRRPTLHLNRRVGFHLRPAPACAASGGRASLPAFPSLLVLSVSFGKFEDLGQPSSSPLR